MLLKKDVYNSVPITCICQHTLAESVMLEPPATTTIFPLLLYSTLSSGLAGIAVPAELSASKSTVDSGILILPCIAASQYLLYCKVLYA